MKLALVGALLGASLSVGDTPRILLKVDKPVAFFPAPVELRTTIYPHPELRTAVLAAEFTSSVWQLDGDLYEQANRRVFTWKIPEPGEHVIALVVYDSRDRVLAQTRVTVSRIAPQ